MAIRERLNVVKPAWSDELLWFMVHKRLRQLV